VKIFFATDIHGSETCWRKFLNSAAFYKADLVVLGGDVTGKVMVPIVAHTGYWLVTLGGEEQRLETQEELEDVKRRIRNRGSYPAIVTPDELKSLNEEEGAVDRRFTVEMLHTLDRWLDMADGKLKGGEIPCIVNGGNDDIWEIDDVIEASPCMNFGEGKVVDIGGFHLASMGWTNPTPWNTFREAPEDELARKIEALAGQIPDMGRAIFNFHAPPYGTGLDEAPALDASLRPTHGGAVLKPVGSTAVREGILKHQPMMSVHGHIHESRGVCKLGRTFAVNPGSVYGDGVLQGAVLELNEKKGKVTKYLLVNG
jgi:Icc-related predicted phosphoesterase